MERYKITPQQFDMIKKIIVYKWNQEGYGLGSGEEEYSLLLQAAQYASLSERRGKLLDEIISKYSEIIN